MLQTLFNNFSSAVLSWQLETALAPVGSVTVESRRGSTPVQLVDTLAASQLTTGSVVWDLSMKTYPPGSEYFIVVSDGISEGTSPTFSISGAHHFTFVLLLEPAFIHGNMSVRVCVRVCVFSPCFLWSQLWM